MLRKGRRERAKKNVRCTSTRKETEKKRIQNTRWKDSGNIYIYGKCVVKGGRPKRSFMDVVKEDMTEVEVTEENTVDKNNRRRKIRCGDPGWEKPKEEEEGGLQYCSG